MIGLRLETGKPLMRAYSIASPSWDEQLEFYSIKVPDGPLTSRLQTIVPGDRVLLGKKATGTLVLDALLPGRRLYLLSTGTGIAPFASIVRDPETYERYEQVIMTQTCRRACELTYGETLVRNLADDPLVGDIAPTRLTYYTSLTREPWERTGRITDLIGSGALFREIGNPPFDPACDRIMICGSMQMIADTRLLAEAAGMREGANSAPAEFVVEKAFVG
jgi:ferredoxin--NADP+ reductase